MERGKKEKFANWEYGKKEGDSSTDRLGKIKSMKSPMVLCTGKRRTTSGGSTLLLLLKGFLPILELLTCRQQNFQKGKKTPPASCLPGHFFPTKGRKGKKVRRNPATTMVLPENSQ